MQRELSLAQQRSDETEWERCIRRGTYLASTAAKRSHHSSQHARSAVRLWDTYTQWGCAIRAVTEIPLLTRHTWSRRSVAPLARPWSSGVDAEVWSRPRQGDVVGTGRLGGGGRGGGVYEVSLSSVRTHGAAHARCVVHGCGCCAHVASVVASVASIACVVSSWPWGHCEGRAAGEFSKRVGCLPDGRSEPLPRASINIRRGRSVRRPSGTNISSRTSTAKYPREALL